MRHAQLSSLAAWTSEGAFLTTLAVYAYAQGGAAEVGVVGFVRLLPSALALPLLALAADRVPRQGLLEVVCLLRAAAITAVAGAVAVGAPAPAVYVGVVLATLAFTAFRPAHGALVPSLCTTPAELAAANALRTLFDGIGALVGPLAAGVALALGSPAWAFGVTAALALSAAWEMHAVRFEPAPLPPRAPSTLREDLFAGMRSLLADRRVLLLIGLGAAQAGVRGALNVLLVLVAVDLVGTGDSGVGLLWAAFGAGALLGATGTFRLAGSGRLALAFGVGLATWGAPLVLLGGSSRWWLSGALLAVVGAGNALVDVTLFTLLQRLVPDAVLGRVLGAAEMVFTVAMAVLSLTVPVLVHLVGAEGALRCVGAFLVLLVVVGLPALRRLDAHVVVRSEEVALMQQVPMLRPLPVPAIEHLAHDAVPCVVPAGAWVFAQGDVGDRFFVIASGTAEVVQDGVVLRALGPGEGFGEIALLSPVPRTAGVLAVTALDLRSLDGADFLRAVTGFGASSRLADDLLASRTGPG